MVKSTYFISTLFALFSASPPLQAQPLSHAHAFTHADTLRGSIGPYRAWWDVTHYDISVKPDFASKSIQGTTFIAFRATGTGQRMQIDLQQPLAIRSMTFSSPAGAADVFWKREGNVAWVDLPGPMVAGSIGTLAIQYGGTPREAINPPWDGGWIWKTDAQGNPWMSLAAQGLGASVWYPCKDAQSDEPDSAFLHITVPDTLQAIGNGRLRSMVKNGDGTTTWNWAVVSPINNYDIVPSIGKYAHWHEVYPGVDGPLDLDFWVLAYNEPKARKQFTQVPLMLNCFENWLGPYPFYADSYKLVEAPQLGMEHQSATAYGNHFMNGYLGRDLSGSGWGLKWDYIIIHESAHEWFGNSITSADIADLWVHEGFADYAETLYTQCQSGEAAGDDYLMGQRRGIDNDKPIIGPYGVNQEGSGDMYAKGANMIHTIRHVMDNDSLFKAMLHGLSKHFYHKVATGAEVETFISQFSGHDFSRVFDEYLGTTMVPELDWTMRKDELFVRWTHVVPGFTMPVKITVNGEERMVPITEAWSSPARGLNGKTVELTANRNWYVTVKRVDKRALKAKKVR